MTSSQSLSHSINHLKLWINMSSKKTKKKNDSLNNGAEVKFLDNTAISNYVLGDSIMENAVKPIKEILKKEKCKETHNFSYEQALDLDQVEIENRRGTSDRENTVDFVVGLENKQLLLVEAKFEVKNVANIVTDFVDKLSHSKRLLNDNINIRSIYKKEIILLSQQSFQQNYNRLRTMLASKSRTTEPQTVSVFYDTFFKRY